MTSPHGATGPQPTTCPWYCSNFPRLQTEISITRRVGHLRLSSLPPNLAKWYPPRRPLMSTRNKPSPGHALSTVFKCNRAFWFVVTLLIAAVSARGQAKIRSLTGMIEGHQVGGVTIDLTGNIYVADFGDTVWKITPEG